MISTRESGELDGKLLRYRVIYEITEYTMENSCTRLCTKIASPDTWAFRKGREIFRRYKKALEDHEQLKKSERDYYFEIVRMVDGIGYDCPVNATTVYQFLEAAERLGMRLEFRPEPFVMDRLDGWEYYIVLVKKRKSISLLHS